MADAGAWPYRYAVLDLTEFFVDSAYQRPLSSMYKKVRDEYNPLLVGTLIASDRGEVKSRPRYALIDGQSRKQGMQDGGHTTVAPAVVYESLNRQQEAELFALLQTERRGMSTWIRFRASLVARQPEAEAIAEIASRTGFKVAGDGDEKGIKSIAALEWLYRRDLLAPTLEVVRDTWGRPDFTKTTADMRVRGEILLGIGRFLKDTDDVDVRRLVRNLIFVPPEQLRHRANALREGSGSSGNYSLFIRDAIVGIYATRSRAASTAATAAS